MRTKITARLLALCLLASLLTGCAGKASDSASLTTGETSGAASSETEETVDFSSMSFIERLTYNRTQISDNLPDRDYDGYSFRIGFLSTGDLEDMYSRDWIATEENGEIVNDAVYSRNLTVAERFDVDITMVDHVVATYEKSVSSPILAGEDAYDMLSCHPGYYGKFIMSGYFLPLTDLEYLNFDQPWWMKNSIESYSFKGTAYSAFGAATAITILADSPVIFYNKDLAAKYDVENLYDVVRSGKWTYDYFTSLIKNMRVDLDGNDVYDENDQYGLHFPYPNQAYRYVWSMGGKYITMSDGEPTLTINTPSMQVIFDNARTLVMSDPVYYTDDYSSDIFKNGSILFENNNLSTIDKLRDLDFEFGILPNFKLDENQENYYTNGGGGPQAIPVTSSDSERTSIVMEALNAEGYKQVIPKYY